MVILIIYILYTYFMILREVGCIGVRSARFQSSIIECNLPTKILKLRAVFTCHV